MKQLIVLSGKGGTGKTSIAAASAHLAHKTLPAREPVLVDADVDAANLELVLRPQRLDTHEFLGGAVAMIDPEKCPGCGLCEEVCRFEAVFRPDPAARARFQIDPVACDGCAACSFDCPYGAISMQARFAGYWFRSQTPYGLLFHAELQPAQDNSGKLVTRIKQHARLHAMEAGGPLLIVDGPPGIGCPTISAAAGADLALIIAEPTAAGIHDMTRILGLTEHFRIPSWVCVNKADLHPEGTEEILAACSQRRVRAIGSLPFDQTVTEAMARGEPVTVFAPDAPISRGLVEVWHELSAGLDPHSR